MRFSALGVATVVVVYLSSDSLRQLGIKSNESYHESSGNADTLLGLCNLCINGVCALKCGSMWSEEWKDIDLAKEARPSNQKHGIP